MAKRKKRYSASKCPEPLNTMIDIAGAVAMGAYVKHKIKQDYKKGYGEDSIRAATMVYGHGAMRRGSAGRIALGGLYGINSAIRDIERNEEQERFQQTRHHVPVYDSGIDFPPYKTNDNRYAWRLNCEDGSMYGVSPQDYETRDAYNRALEMAKRDRPAVQSIETEGEEEIVTENPFSGSKLSCCRVSRLDNGANEYYLTEDESIKVGDTITVSTDAGTAEGVVIGIKRLSDMTDDELPEESMWILTQEDDHNGTV